MTFDELVTAFVTLFVIIDPIGITPLFVALTQGMTPERQRSIGKRALLVGFGLLALFGLVGQRLLEAIGIGMPAFAISGGLLLFVTAFDMLFERRSDRRERTVHSEGAHGDGDSGNDPSVFPLATPLIAGPGALATMILLVSQHPGDPLALLGIHLAMALVLVLTWVLFRASRMIERVLGRTGIIVATRLFGILLAALAVQFILNGLRDQGLLGSLPGG